MSEPIQYRMVIIDEHYSGTNTFYYKTLEEVQNAIRQIELDLSRRPELIVYEAHWQEMDKEIIDEYDS